MEIDISASEDFLKTPVVGDYTVGGIKEPLQELFEDLLDKYAMEEEEILNKIWNAKYGKWPKVNLPPLKSVSPASSPEYRYTLKSKFSKANLLKVPMRYRKERKLASFECGEEFESGNYFSKGQLVKLIITALLAANIVLKLTANYNYTHVLLSFTTDGERTYSAVFDTGFRYSALDRNFLEKVIEPAILLEKGDVKIEDLP
ncbi:hypothetical protein TWF481_003006 [Arthrobotrys musiformis]|uniref:Uncharacterized protein n=1 Tax=Arthrobotrys musiformis TaxID=47236 RepID=A0AAV9VRW9_9PEZI